MKYSLPALWKTPLLIIALLLAFPAYAETTGIDIHFTTAGTILPRRGHEMLTLESANVDRLSAAILHVPEADTLRVLAHPDIVPPEAVEIWHAQIEVRPNGAPPVAGQVAKSTLDVLQLIKPLQPGLYIATAHEVTTGTPRAQATKLFMISNIGLETFVGADGLAVQARLLSEANPAAGIDIALIARNNREIARLHSDDDGIARFDADQISGKGDDTPAAVYAYGADGEFTALPISLPLADPQLLTRAMIMTDRTSYQPGETIHGLTLVRNADGSAATSAPVYLQLETADGAVAAFHTAIATDASGFSFSFPAYKGANIIRAYRNIDNNPVLLGETPITIGAGGDAPTTQAQNDTDTIVGDAIKIAPGRRSFQPGEMASVSVQPPMDSFVTIALVDRSVHAIVRQKISKDGAVVQLPVPADAAGGMYVIATAFTPPADNKAITRLYGMEWIDIDQGAKRMSVRIDTPERAEIGNKLPVDITLQDLGQDLDNKFAKVQLVGNDEKSSQSLDPLSFFYGRRKLAVKIFDSYGSIIGAASSGVPDFIGANATAKPSAPALLWPRPMTVNKNGKADFNELFPQMSGAAPRLTLSAIAWSDDRLGFAQASVIGVDPKSVGHKALKQPAPPPATPVHARAVLLKPGQSVNLKPLEGIVASIDPLIAAPAAFDNNKPLFVTADMPQFRDYLQRLLIPANDPTLLGDAVLSLALSTQALDLPQVTTARMLDAVQTLLAQSSSDDQKMVAHYVLLKSGRETVLEVAAWLKGNPKLTTLPAKAARLALAPESPLFKIDLKIDATPLMAEIDNPAIKADTDARAIALCLLAEANQPWPSKLAHILSSAPAAADLALRVAQAAHLPFGGAMMKFTGTNQTGNAIVAAAPLKAENADTRILHALVLSGLPQ